MTKTYKIEVPHSKKQLIKFLIFSVLALVIGVWMIVAKPHTSNPVFDNIIVKNFAAYGAVLMGIFGLYFFSKKLFDKNAGLIIDEEGIIDNSSAVSVGKILWKDIMEITERSIQASITSKQKFITIILKNPEEYISRQTNVIKRKSIAMNVKYTGSPVNISTNGLTMPFEELKNLLIKKLHEFEKENNIISIQ